MITHQISLPPSIIIVIMGCTTSSQRSRPETGLKQGSEGIKDDNDDNLLDKSNANTESRPFLPMAFNELRNSDCKDASQVS